MQTYQATIRVGGSLFNEVPKAPVTAAEIEVLKAIHGDDAVLRIAPHKIVDPDEAKRFADATDEEERERLRLTYGKALATRKHLNTIEAILGTRGVPLPKTVPGVDSLPAPKRGRMAKAEDISAVVGDNPAEQASFE